MIFKTLISTLKILILTLSVVLISSELLAQKSPIDPAGYITKYNVAFAGIGPEVYILPAPRTKQEILIESYQLKSKFTDTINSELEYQDLLKDFKSTINAQVYKELILENKLTQVDIKLNVADVVLQQNYTAAYNWLNEAAALALKHKDVQLSIDLLLDAHMHAQKTSNEQDLALIQYNLALIYLFDQQVEQADLFQKKYYEFSLTAKTPVEQGNSLVQLALIQAGQGDFRVAENTIIRKAIPLFNKHKAYEGKINAWKQLATIYQEQNKHAEAQWFLLQAKDLANDKKLINELAELEYMLASSKMTQKNYSVAQKELKQAEVLALAENNKYLALAIQDKIGNIHLLFNQFDDAEASLAAYWSLRNEIF